MLRLVLRLIFVSGTDGAGAGAVWGTVTIVLWRGKQMNSKHAGRSERRERLSWRRGRSLCILYVCISEWVCDKTERIYCRCVVNSKTVLSLMLAVSGCLPHLLLLEILPPTHQRQIEPNPKAVLEEKRGSAAVQLTLGDDSDAVAQQVSLVHVVSGQDHSPSCNRVKAPRSN